MWGYRVRGTSYRIGSRAEAERRLAEWLVLLEPLRVGEQVDGDPNEARRFVVHGAAADYHRAYLIEFRA